MLREVKLRDIPHNHPVALFEQYWRSNCNEKGIFHRSTFKPMMLPKLLPWTIVLDPEESENGTEYIYRLYGTGVARVFNVDLTGKYMGEGIKPDLKAQLISEFVDAMQSNHPVFSETPVPMAGRDFIHIYRGVFPVTRTGDEIDQIIVVIAEKAYKI